MSKSKRPLVKKSKAKNAERLEHALERTEGAMTIEQGEGMTQGIRDVYGPSEPPPVGAVTGDQNVARGEKREYYVCVTKRPISNPNGEMCFWISAANAEEARRIAAKHYPPPEYSIAQLQQRG